MSLCICIRGRGIGGTILKKDCPVHGAVRGASEGGELIAQLRGRAAFCRDRGEVKTPELLEAAAQALVKARGGA